MVCSTAGGMEELFGEGKEREKEASEYLPSHEGATWCAVCAGCAQPGVWPGPPSTGRAAEPDPGPRPALQHRRDVPVSGGNPSESSHL